jgi:hypothetical protein
MARAYPALAAGEPCGVTTRTRACPGLAAACGAASGRIPRPSASTKKARAKGDSAVRSRTTCPVDLLAQRAGDPQQTVIAERVLGQRHQLRGQHVLECHDAHVHAEHREILPAGEDLV